MKSSRELDEWSALDKLFVDGNVKLARLVEFVVKPTVNFSLLRVRRRDDAKDTDPEPNRTPFVIFKLNRAAFQVDSRKGQ